MQKGGKMKKTMSEGSIDLIVDMSDGVLNNQRRDVFKIIDKMEVGCNPDEAVANDLIEQANKYFSQLCFLETNYRIKTKYLDNLIYQEKQYSYTLKRVKDCLHNYKTKYHILKVKDEGDPYE